MILEKPIIPSKFTADEVKIIYYHVLDNLLPGWPQQMKNDVIHCLCNDWFYSFYHSYRNPPLLLSNLFYDKNESIIIDSLSDDEQSFKVLTCWGCKYIFCKTEEDANFARLLVSNLMLMPPLSQLYKRLDEFNSKRKYVSC